MVKKYLPLLLAGLTFFSAIGSRAEDRAETLGPSTEEVLKREPLKKQGIFDAVKKIKEDIDEDREIDRGDIANIILKVDEEKDIDEKEKEKYKDMGFLETFVSRFDKKLNDNKLDLYHESRDWDGKEFIYEREFFNALGDAGNIKYPNLFELIEDGGKDLKSLVMVEIDYDKKECVPRGGKLCRDLTRRGRALGRVGSGLWDLTTLKWLDGDYNTERKEKRKDVDEEKDIDGKSVKINPEYKDGLVAKIGFRGGRADGLTVKIAKDSAEMEKGIRFQDISKKTVNFGGIDFAINGQVCVGGGYDWESNDAYATIKVYVPIWPSKNSQN